MIAISKWARQHSILAIILIVFLKCSLVTLAIYTGLRLTYSGIFINDFIPIVCIPILVLITLQYPHVKHNYLKRKLLDFSISAISFVCIVTFINNLDNPIKHTNSSYANTVINTKKKSPTANQILASLQYRDKNSLTRKEKRILRKEFNLQLKNYVVYSIQGDNQKKNETGKIILTIVAAVGLLFLLSSLVCSLSCNGADVAAVLVGVIGLTALIWGTIAVIKTIKRKSAKPRSTSP